jgi:hypothetical protein
MQTDGRFFFLWKYDELGQKSANVRKVRTDTQSLIGPIENELARLFRYRKDPPGVAITRHRMRTACSLPRRLP